MGLCIKSIIIFLCVVTVDSHADSKDPHKKSHFTPRRRQQTEGPKRVLKGRKLRDGYADVDVGRANGVNVNTGRSIRGGSNVHVGRAGVEVLAGPNGKPVYVTVAPGLIPFQYNNYGGRHMNRNYLERSLFFLEKDMKPGHQMTMNFTQTKNGATFIPRDKARTIPFSTDKMPQILREFSVQPGSEEAQTIEETIKGCESEGVPGEHKYCATCLEDMVDYVKSTLGRNVKTISTEVTNGFDKGQNYTFGKVIKAARDDNVMVCHKLNYAYAVFYCHKTKGTSPHIVSLISETGTDANVVAVCHKDTSSWNPKHLAFQVLNVKPGSLPVCQFLPEEHIVWVRA
ncbi:BURP domain-containing protein 6-like [Silene latifolia]|uniref:BURP domain-containing protein 6-like n=1 Tax=Silene latifolia TaxID=37657 RepID=UPI003D76A5AA